MDMQSTSETVSQSEVERLLAQVEGADMSSADAGSNRKGSSDHELIHRHEFPKLSFFSGSELRKLRVRHEGFIGSLAGRLSIYLGLEVGLQMSKLETLPYQKFVEGLSNPTHLTLLKIEPLNGTCLVDIPPHLGLCIVDRELGGPAVCLEEPRDLGKMEARLLARVIEIIVSEWCSSWSDLHDLRPVLMKHETNGRFLQTSAPDTTMLVLGIATRVGEVADQIQFAFPYHTLEPLMLKLNAAAELEGRPAAALASAPLKWNPLFDDVEIMVKAELPELSVTARQMAELKLGDVIPIPTGLASQVRVSLGETHRFSGNLGTSKNRWAVQISEVVKS
jgi:flagellar motor switch protein FliM